MKEHPPAYRAYLLRLWPEEASETRRASVEDAHTGEHHEFATLEALFGFLARHTRSSQPPAAPPNSLSDTTTPPLH